MLVLVSEQYLISDCEGRPAKSHLSCVVWSHLFIISILTTLRLAGTWSSFNYSNIVHTIVLTQKNNSLNVKKCRHPTLEVWRNCTTMNAYPTPRLSVILPTLTHTYCIFYSISLLKHNGVDMTILFLTHRRVGRKGRRIIIDFYWPVLLPPSLSLFT